MSALLLAATPALPLDEAGKYVAGAYVVFLVLIVVYVAIMASKLQRMEKELRELAGFAESRAQGEAAAPGRGSEGQSISDSLALTGAEEAAPDE
jgi:hypothetical protein